MAENIQPQQRLRMVNIIGPEGTVIANGVLISPNAEDVTVKNQVGQGTDVSANLKDFLFQKFSSTTETDDEGTVTIRTVGNGYFSIDPSKISILQSWSDYQNLNKKRLVGLYDSDGNYIADFLSRVENLDPTLAQFETTDTGENIDEVIAKYNCQGYTPVKGVNADDSLITDKQGDTEVVSAEEQAAEFMASFGDSSFWQQIIDREIENKNRLLGLYDANGDVVGYFEPTEANIEAIKSAYRLETNKKAYDLVIDLNKKSLYQHLVELNNFWQDLPSEEYNQDEQSGVNIATKYDIDRLNWVTYPTTEDSLDFSLSVDGSLTVVNWHFDESNLLSRFVNIPPTVNNRVVTSIMPQVFQENQDVQQIVAGENIEEIGALAFKGCSNLTRVQLTNLKKIGSQAFSGCTSLSSISLDNIEVIKDSAFVGCNLTEVKIPDSCTVLDGYAFDDCSKLEKVTIGNGISNIALNTFNDCIALQEIRFGNSISSIHVTAFSNCPALTAIYIDKPENSVIGAPWGAVNATVHWNTSLPTEEA